jgi:uncharacterized protein YaaR (DUF327 family)
MAKVDGAGDASFYMNPAAYAQVKDEKKAKEIKRDRDFSKIFDDLRGKTADDIGPLLNLPVSEDSINLLMDDVRSTGDTLQSRPFPEEIMRYKQAVRNFLNYVVKNAYELEHDEGIKNKFRPSFQGRRNTPEGDKYTVYTKIQVIDKKLEDLAAMLLSSQSNQIKLVSRLEEIRGLLIDLLQ